MSEPWCDSSRVVACDHVLVHATLHGHCVNQTNNQDVAPVIALTSLVRRYRHWESKRLFPAVAGVTLDIPAGQWVCLLGPNGSGKSTLLRLLCGLERADQGSARIFGNDPSHGGRVLAKMGVVFQRPALDRLLTVRENLALQAALHGVTSQVSNKIHDAAERAQITERLDSRVDTLSGGLMRRADLARAMLPDPGVLLLDEPTAGLDHAARMAFMETLGSLRDGSGRTILMSTHLMDEAELCDRVVMMDEGRVVADGSPEELRAACGGVVVRCTGAAMDRVEAVMATAGLSRERHGRIVIGRGPTLDATHLAGVVNELLLLGASVQAGPPTLADEYLAKTGKSLEPDDTGDPKPTARWSAT